MGYAWTITSDSFDGEDVGVTGPRSVNLGAKEIIAHPGRQHFKMYDDDGNHYYSGFLVGGDGFEPLDDFGTPNAGCTEIRYRGKDGRYSTL